MLKKGKIPFISSGISIAVDLME